MKITWIIEHMEWSAEDETISSVHWRVTGVDGSQVGTLGGTAFLSAKAPVGVDALTEDQVVDLLKAVVDVEGIEAAVESQISDHKSARMVRGLPWQMRAEKDRAAVAARMSRS